MCTVGAAGPPRSSSPAWGTPVYRKGVGRCASVPPGRLSPLHLPPEQLPEGPGRGAVLLVAVGGCPALSASVQLLAYALTLSATYRTWMTFPKCLFSYRTGSCPQTKGPVSAQPVGPSPAIGEFFLWARPLRRPRATGDPWALEFT